MNISVQIKSLVVRKENIRQGLISNAYDHKKFNHKTGARRKLSKAKTKIDKIYEMSNQGMGKKIFKKGCCKILWG